MTTTTKQRGKMKSGFCGIGSCEGTRPRSPSGKPMKVCFFIEDCPCECHTVLDEMCELTGTPRVFQDNPEYIPVKSVFWMPTPDDLVAMRAAVPPRDRGGSRSTADGPLPVLPAITDESAGVSGVAIQPYDPNPRTRRPLEAEVKKVCDEWGGVDCALTLQYIAESIDPDEPRSVGAIREVLIRWDKYGFATYAEDPLRFTGYTPTGVTKGLDVMKWEYTSRDRQVKKSLERGYGRK